MTSNTSPFLLPRTKEMRNSCASLHEPHCDGRRGTNSVDYARPESLTGSSDKYSHYAKLCKGIREKPSAAWTPKSFANLFLRLLPPRGVLLEISDVKFRQRPRSGVFKADFGSYGRENQKGSSPREAWERRRRERGPLQPGARSSGVRRPVSPEPRARLRGNRELCAARSAHALRTRVPRGAARKWAWRRSPIGPVGAGPTPP